MRAHLRAGPKFDYKLRWFDRLARHAAELLATGMPVVLAGDFNVMPTNLDVHKPERWVDDALFRPEVREEFHGLLAQGWTDALRALHPGERIYTFWDYFRNGLGTRASVSTICSSAPQLLTAWWQRMWTGKCTFGRGRAIMRLLG